MEINAHPKGGKHGEEKKGIKAKRNRNGVMVGKDYTPSDQMGTICFSNKDYKVCTEGIIWQ